jgi:hypothetical protein
MGGSFVSVLNIQKDSRYNDNHQMKQLFMVCFLLDKFSVIFLDVYTMTF